MRRLSAVETVCARIVMAIELGLADPGDRLPGIGEVAQAFGVSEMSVRRGFQLLHDQGVLIRRRGRAGGTFVSHNPIRATDSAIGAYRTDIERVVSLIDQRAAIEGGLAHLAAQTATAAEVSELHELTEQMRAVDNWADFRHLDTRFHEGLANAAHLPAAAALHREITNELYSYFLPYPLTYLHRSNEEHAQIVAALLAHDCATAAEVAIDHVRELHESMYIGLSKPRINGHAK
ncbi:MAG: FCD domain-containing protein [Gordonia sp. (in: high G+C Gram-positive bacteria)]